MLTNTHRTWRERERKKTGERRNQLIGQNIKYSIASVTRKNNVMKEKKEGF